MNQIEATQKDRDSQLALLRAKRAEDGRWWKMFINGGGGGTKKNVTVDQRATRISWKSKKVQFVFTGCYILGRYDVFCCFFLKWGLHSWDQENFDEVTPIFFCKKKGSSRKMGPIPVRNGVWTLHTWPSKWVTGVRTLLIGVITPFITGFWGPPYRHVSSSLFFPDLAEWVAMSSSLTTGKPQGENTREAREKGTDG